MLLLLVAMPFVTSSDALAPSSFLLLINRKNVFYVSCGSVRLPRTSQLT